MSDEKLIPVDIDSLKPGDTVYIAKAMKFGTTPFRYPRLVDETVIRVTPKKTKLITDKGDYIVSQTKIYQDNPECHRQRAITGAVIACLNCIGDMSYYRYNIRKLSDEQISQLATHIMAASAILDTTKSET